MDHYLANVTGALAIALCDAQDRAMAEMGRPRADLEALLAVHARPGSTVGDVAVTTGLTHSGAVRVVDRLQELGWVARGTGPDRRTAAIVCTDAGHRQAESALELRRGALALAVDGLPERDRRALHRIAETMLAAFPERRADAWRICRLCDHDVCDGARCPVGAAVP